MPTKTTRTSTKRPTAPARAISAEAKTAVAALKRKTSKQFRKDMQARYGIVTDKAFGVPMSQIKALGKTMAKGRDPAERHALAEALWKTGWYEARTLAAFIDDPALVTPAQMDRWRRGFDNWAICDTVCFHLFDKAPNAYRKIEQWSRLRDEFGRRAAFALLASLALHDKAAPDRRFMDLLPLIERAASDDRNFVKKSVSWALRAVAGRSPALRAAARNLAQDLAGSQDPAERWVGKDVLRKIR